MSDDLVPAILWCDLETTGLDAKTGMMLEIGLRITDWRGREIDSWTSLIWNEGWRGRLATNDFVWDMHTESGLIGDLEDLEINRRVIDYTLESVTQQALTWLAERAPADTGPHDGKFPMAGNSLGGVDRPFLREHAPAINDWFSYRDLDVSSMREACRVTNKALHAREPEVEKSHRPQEDISNSILLWNHYIDNFFWTDADFMH